MFSNISHESKVLFVETTSIRWKFQENLLNIYKNMIAIWNVPFLVPQSIVYLPAKNTFSLFSWRGIIKLFRIRYGREMKTLILFISYFYLPVLDFLSCDL